MLMKNIIGFEDVCILVCNECGCVFTINENEDVEDWNINARNELYTSCPNCKSIFNRIVEVRKDKYKK